MRRRRTTPAPGEGRQGGGAEGKDDDDHRARPLALHAATPLGPPTSPQQSRVYAGGVAIRRCQELREYPLIDE